jgi:hypothetical protein
MLRKSGVKLKYLGTTGTNQSIFTNNLKNRLNSGNACYHSVQNLLSSRLISKSLRFKLHNIIIVPVVSYPRGSSSFSQREEHKLRVCENRLLRRILGRATEDVTGRWTR